MMRAGYGQNNIDEQFVIDSIKKVLDILEKEELAVVYPYNIGYIPLGPLVREEKVGWIGVNWELDFSPKYQPTEKGKEELL